FDAGDELERVGFGVVLAALCRAVFVAQEGLKELSVTLEIRVVGLLVEREQGVSRRSGRSRLRRGGVGIGGAVIGRRSSAGGKYKRGKSRQKDGGDGFHRFLLFLKDGQN